MGPTLGEEPGDLHGDLEALEALRSSSAIVESVEAPLSISETMLALGQPP